MCYSAKSLVKDKRCACVFCMLLGYLGEIGTWVRMRVLGGGFDLGVRSDKIVSRWCWVGYVRGD